MRDGCYWLYEHYYERYVIAVSKVLFLCMYQLSLDKNRRSSSAYKWTVILCNVGSSSSSSYLRALLSIIQHHQHHHRSAAAHNWSFCINLIYQRLNKKKTSTKMAIRSSSSSSSSSRASLIVVLLACSVIVSSWAQKTISVTNGASAPQSTWGPVESCPPGSKAVGFDTQNDLVRSHFLSMPQTINCDCHYV